MTAIAAGIPWHGTHEVATGRVLSLSVGTLGLSIAHLVGEWRIGWQRPTDDLPEDSAHHGASTSILDDVADPAPRLPLQRYLTASPDPRIALQPRLADRPVVARPHLPLAVPAGDEACIFVSTPVWVRAVLLDPERELFELPSTQLSDTWFGPDTRDGIVAYAARTAARLEIENLPPQPHRAITRVTVRNKARSVLPLERLAVPTPSLPLYGDHRGGLWTAPLVVERESATSPANVTIDDRPPGDADAPRRLATPREPSERSVLSRALHVLVG